MKKFILVSAALFLQTLCFAADVKVIKDCKIYDGYYHFEGTLKKGTIVKLWDCSTQDERKNSKLDFDYSACLNIDGQKRLTDAYAVIPVETEELFDVEKTTIKLNENYKRWIDKDSCDLLYYEDRENFYKENQQEINYHESRRGVYDEVWYNDSYFYGCPEVSFYNLFVNMFDNDYYFSAYVLRISSVENGYLVKLEIENKGEMNKADNDFNSLYSLVPDIGEQFELRIVFDGDFMYVYHANGTLMFTNVVVDDSFCNEYENLIRTNKCDLSKVTWPRHADGSSDFDDKIEPPLIRLSENNKAGNTTADASDNPTRPQRMPPSQNPRPHWERLRPLPRTCACARTARRRRKSSPRLPPERA